jgi:PAS domain S-box-containing protein
MAPFDESFVTADSDFADIVAYRALYEHSPMATAFVGPAGGFVRANPAFERFIGRSERELRGLFIADITFPEDRDASRRAFREMLENGQPWMVFEKRYLRPEGTIVWGRVNVAAIRDSDEKFIGACAMIADVTEQRASIEQQTHLNSLLEATIDATNDGLIVVDASGKIMASNLRFAELWQMPDELIDARDDDALLRFAMTKLVHPEKFISRVQSVYANREAISSDILEFKDGRILARSSRPQKIGEKVTGLVWSFRDITAQKMAEAEREAAIRRSEILAEASRVLAESLDYQTTIRTIPDVIVPQVGDWSAIGISEPDGGMSLISFKVEPEAPEILERILKTILDPSAPEGIPRVIRSGKAMLYSEVTEKDLNPEGDAWPIIGTRDPKVIASVRKLGLCSFMIVPLVVRGKVIGAMSVASAHGPRRYDERDLGLAEELGRRIAVALDSATLYRDALRTIQVREDFLSVASHELRTPLTPLRMQLEMAQFFLSNVPADFPQRADLMELISGAGNQMDRLLKLVNNILDVSRITAGRLNLHCEWFELGAVVREAISRFDTEFKGAGCPVTLKLEDGVNGYWDRGRLEQVLMNFLSNATKFGVGKPIEVRLESRAGEAHLSVSDHGIGVDPADYARIFERFERASSSRSYQGFGLGLYICREIVAAHAGKIEVDRALDGGAIFTVRLPLRNRKA